MQNFILHWRFYERAKLEKKLPRLAQQGYTGSFNSEASQAPSPHIHAGKLDTLFIGNQESGLVLPFQKEATNRNTQTKL